MSSPAFLFLLFECSGDFGIPEESSRRKPAASRLRHHCASPILLQPLRSGVSIFEECLNHSAVIKSDFFFFLKALIDDITSGNPQGAFDPLSDFHDLANDSRSASPTPSVSNRSVVDKLIACDVLIALFCTHCLYHVGKNIVLDFYMNGALQV